MAPRRPSPTLVACSDTEVPPLPPHLPCLGQYPPLPMPRARLTQTQPLVAVETCVYLEHIPVGSPEPRFSPQSLSLCFDGSKNFCLLNPRGPVSGSKKGKDDEIGLLWLGLCVGETVVNLSRQHSGLYQYSVCEGPAPMLRARLNVHPSAPKKHPGLGIFF